MAEINERVNALERDRDEMKQDIKEVRQDMDAMKDDQKTFFGKVFKRLDALETKMGKFMKWIYRLLGVIIVLLIIIAIKSPETATQIMSSAGTVMKSI